MMNYYSSRSVLQQQHAMSSNAQQQHAHHQHSNIKAQKRTRNGHNSTYNQLTANSLGHLVYKRDELILDHHDLFMALWVDGFQPQERTEKEWVVYTLRGKLNPPVEVSLPCDISATPPSKMQAFLRRVGKNFMCNWEMVADNWTSDQPPPLPPPPKASFCRKNAGSSEESRYTGSITAPSHEGGENSRSLMFMHEHMEHKLAERQQLKEKESHVSVNETESVEYEENVVDHAAAVRRQEWRITV